MYSKIRLIINITLTLVILIFLVPLPASFALDTLWSLYQEAVKKDPLLKEAQAQLKASLQEKPLARSQLLPRLEAQIGQGYYDKNITGIGPKGIKKDYWGDNYGARLVQPIFNGQAYVSLKMAESIISAQEAQVIYARQDLIKRVALAYIDLLDAKSLLRVAKDRLRLDSKIVERAKDFLKVGTGDIVSVREAEARLDSAKAGIVKAKNLVTIKRTNLSVITKTSVGKVADINRFIPLLPDPDDKNAWIKAALDNQPILKKAQKRLVFAKQSIEHERRARWPRADLEVVADYANGQFLPDVIYREAHGVFKITFPFYLGGAIGARTRRAEEEAIAAKHRLEQIEDRVTIQTTNAFSRLKDSVALINAAKKALESARVSMDATNKGYEVGTRDVIDVLDMTDKYLVAKQRYLHSLYDHLRARILLKSASGTISERDLKSIEALLVADGQKGEGSHGAK